LIAPEIVSDGLGCLSEAALKVGYQLIIVSL
jgi:hypothetical protein